MRVLITGSRNWNGLDEIQQAFDMIQEKITGDPYTIPTRAQAGEVVIVSGRCPSGADYHCERAAFGYGYRVEPHPARWNLHGKAAGMIRNKEMVDLGADVCFGFVKDCSDWRCDKPRPHESHGATDCIMKATGAGIPTFIWRMRSDMSESRLFTFFERKWHEIPRTDLRSGPDGWSAGFELPGV